LYKLTYQIYKIVDNHVLHRTLLPPTFGSTFERNVNRKTSRSFREKETVAHNCNRAGERGKIIDANPATRMGTLFTSTERHIALPQPIPTIPVLDASAFRRGARLLRKCECLVLKSDFSIIQISNKKIPSLNFPYSSKDDLIFSRKNFSLKLM